MNKNWPVGCRKWAPARCNDWPQCDAIISWEKKNQKLLAFSFFGAVNKKKWILGKEKRIFNGRLIKVLRPAKGQAFVGGRKGGRGQAPPANHDSLASWLVLFFKFFFIRFFLPSFYWVLMGFDRPFLGFPGLPELVMGFTSVWMCFNGCYWVLLGFTGFYWVLLGFIGFLPSFT